MHISCIQHHPSHVQSAEFIWFASFCPMQISTPVHSTSYCVSPVSTEVVYTFKVRSGMSDLCGPSDFWSDWSEEVQWISKKGTVLWCSLHQHFSLQSCSWMFVYFFIFLSRCTAWGVLVCDGHGSGIHYPHKPVFTVALQWTVRQIHGFLLFFFFFLLVVWLFFF